MKVEEDKCASCPDKDKCKVNPRQKELDEKVEGNLYEPEKGFKEVTEETKEVSK